MPQPLTDAEIEAIVARVRFDDRGLVPAIAQAQETGEVLMLAWMNAHALRTTLRERRGVYWSRSRKALWRKGETSGHGQDVHEVRLDCDADTILLLISQTGPACHTNRRSCFFVRVDQAPPDEDAPVPVPLASARAVQG